MIALLPDENSSVDAAGRVFFSSQTSAEDRKQFLEYMLGNGRFEQICKLMYCGHLNGNIDMKNTSADYLAMTGENPTLNTRYFNLFLTLSSECGVGEDKLIPLLFQAVAADKRSALRGWKKSAERYLTELARADYDRAWAYLRKNDRDFRLISILLQADRERTLVDLVHLAVFGKGVNKVALRNILRGYMAEVYAFVRSEYDIMKTNERMAAVRLLLLFKNDPEVAQFLYNIADTEKAESVRKLLVLGVKPGPGIAENPTRAQVSKYFYEMMVRGVVVSAERFLTELIVPPCAEIADSLFFSVYKNGVFDSIVIVDNGRVLDLENSPVSLDADCEIKVLHPVELTAKTDYLKRLNIVQPFEQVKRKVYVPSSLDKCSNCCSSIAGTIVKFGDFKTGMRKLGFRVLNRDRDGVCRQVGLNRNGILCVLDIAPVEFAVANFEDPLLAYSVRFYAEKDVIRLGGQLFVEGVTPIDVARVDARVYSEFMYSVYELMGCQ